MRSHLQQLLTATAIVCAGCQEAPARPQVELFIDVDMPVPAQIGEALSTDAMVDSLRIEVLDADLSVKDSRTFSISSLEVLPLSFGIPTELFEGGHALVRIRAYRAAFATPGELEESPVLDPIAEVTVDRLVDVSLPAEGVGTAAVTLHGDCIGTRITLPIGDAPGFTCLDGEHLHAAATEGIDATAPVATSAGTWARARRVACRADAPEGTVCIPGGLMVFGDPAFQNVGEYDLASLPLRVVQVDPFFLDLSEVTVGDMRALIADGYDGPLPYAPEPDDPSKADCTWESPAGALPVNCIDVGVGDAVCAARGGKIPSEVRWEYAARGHGARLLYSWGSSPPACCSASIGRGQNLDCEAEQGIEAVRSHPGSVDCLGDVSPDGIYDLGGSVSELVLDSVSSLADACWEPLEGGPAILVNPICKSATGRVARGGAWGFAFADAPLPVRRTFLEDDPYYGFRCAYEDVP